MSLLAVVLSMQMLFLVSCVSDQASGEIASESSKDQESAVRQTQKVEFESMGWTMDQYIEASANVFLGICTQKQNGMPSDILQFKVLENYKGEIDPSVTDFLVLHSEEGQIQEDVKLLVCCGREGSVFADNDVYGVSVCFFEKDGKLISNSPVQSQWENLESLSRYVENYVKEHPGNNANHILMDYCRSEDIGEIYEASDAVFSVKITGIMDGTMPDRTSYSFEVEDVIKGEYKGEEWVIALKDSMTVGEEYLILVNQPENSRYCIISSKKSVIKPDSEESVKIPG